MLKDGSRGFSLVGVLMAIFILCVLFIPLSQLLVTGAQSSQYSEDYLQALNIGRSQIAMLRQAARLDKHSVEGLIAKFCVSTGFRDFEVHDKFRVHTEVNPQACFVDIPDVSLGKAPSPDLDATLIQVVVRVDWEVSGNARRLDLEAYIDRSYY